MKTFQFFLALLAAMSVVVFVECTEIVPVASKDEKLPSCEGQKSCSNGGCHELEQPDLSQVDMDPTELPPCEKKEAERKKQCPCAQGDPRQFVEKIPKQEYKYCQPEVRPITPPQVEPEEVPEPEVVGDPSLPDMHIEKVKCGCPKEKEPTCDDGKCDLPCPHIKRVCIPCKCKQCHVPDAEPKCKEPESISVEDIVDNDACACEAEEAEDKALKKAAEIAKKKFGVETGAAAQEDQSCDGEVARDDCGKMKIVTDVSCKKQCHKKHPKLKPKLCEVKDEGIPDPVVVNVQPYMDAQGIPEKMRKCAEKEDKYKDEGDDMREKHPTNQ